MDSFAYSICEFNLLWHWVVWRRWLDPEPGKWGYREMCKEVAHRGDAATEHEALAAVAALGTMRWWKRWSASDARTDAATCISAAAPRYAVASVGGRYQWLLWRRPTDPALAEEYERSMWFVSGADDGGFVEPDAAGEAPTREAAIRAVLEAAGEPALPLQPGFVASYRRDRAARRRMRAAQAADPSAQADAPELVYDVFYSVPDDSYYAAGYCYTPHVVVRKTARWVYVERQPAWFRDTMAKRIAKDGVRIDDYTTTCYRLDRAALERGEVVYHRHTNAYREGFILDPERHRRAHARDSRPSCIVALGLGWPCDAPAVKAAYRRLSQERHPDVGGDHDAFIALTAAYQAALELATAHERRPVAQEV